MPAFNTVISSSQLIIFLICAAGRTDVQSCCWWGRGAAQAKGVCLYGKLNYYLGARAQEEGRRSLYPSVDVSGTIIHYFSLVGFLIERSWYLILKLLSLFKVLPKSTSHMFGPICLQLNVGYGHVYLD